MIKNTPLNINEQLKKDNRNRRWTDKAKKLTLPLFFTGLAVSAIATYEPEHIEIDYDNNIAKFHQKSIFGSNPTDVYAMIDSKSTEPGKGVESMIKSENPFLGNKIHDALEIFIEYNNETLITNENPINRTNPKVLTDQYFAVPVYKARTYF